jgi:hypothetical protein
LVFREIDLDAETFKDVDHALPNLRPKLVNEAGHEKLDAFGSRCFVGLYRHRGQT